MSVKQPLVGHGASAQRLYVPFIEGMDAHLQKEVRSLRRAGPALGIELTDSCCSAPLRASAARLPSLRRRHFRRESTYGRSNRSSTLPLRNEAMPLTFNHNYWHCKGT